MKPKRLWIEIIVPPVAIACALAFLIAILGAAAGVAAGAQNSSGAAESRASQPQTYAGMITDTQCGAKHSATIGRAAGDCALACVRGGAKFALVDGNKTYILDGDLALLKKVAGRRATVTGDLSGNTIKVSSVAAGI